MRKLAGDHMLVALLVGGAVVCLLSGVAIGFVFGIWSCPGP